VKWFTFGREDQKNKYIQAELTISHNTVFHTLRELKAQALIRRSLVLEFDKSSGLSLLG